MQDALSKALIPESVAIKHEGKKIGFSINERLDTVDFLPFKRILRSLRDIFKSIPNLRVEKISEISILFLDVIVNLKSILSNFKPGLDTQGSRLDNLCV